MHIPRSLRLIAVLAIISAHSVEAATISESAVLSLDRGFDSAILNSDTAFLERTLDSTFRFTHHDGKTQSKKELIEAVGAGRLKAKVREVADQAVESHGDIAVVTGRTHFVRDVPDPARRDYSVGYVRVYAIRDGDLRLLSHRSVSTTLPE